jgi:hypothetical protein
MKFVSASSSTLILFNESAMAGEIIKRTLHAVLVSILSAILNDII